MKTPSKPLELTNCSQKFTYEIVDAMDVPNTETHTAYYEIMKTVHTLPVGYNHSTLFIHVEPVNTSFDGVLFIFMTKGKIFIRGQPYKDVFHSWSFRSNKSNSNIPLTETIATNNLAYRSAIFVRNYQQTSVWGLPEFFKEVCCVKYSRTHDFIWSVYSHVWAECRKLINLYSPWNHQKTYGFLMITGRIVVN